MAKKSRDKTTPSEEELLDDAAVDTEPADDVVDSTKESAADSSSEDDAADKEAAPKRRRREKKPKPARIGNPQWFVPVMLGLFVIGLIWIVIFYLSQTEYPIPGRGYWNLVIGFGILMSGFAMATRWK